VALVEVVFSNEFEAWWNDLDEEQQEDVAAHVRVLGDRGTVLSFPRSSAVCGSRIALRELRVQSAGRPLRVFYVFDPKRQAVLLIGGDKTGRDRFYEEMIPIAERICQEYLRETGRE
jgi:hypothetical protein